MSKPNLNSQREIAKAKATLKRIANHIADRCSYFYTYLDSLIKDISKALASNPNADISEYINKFYDGLKRLIEENMEYAYDNAFEREEQDKDSFAWLYPLILIDKDYDKASRIYSEALSQEIEFFKRNNGNPFELSLYIKDPIAYIAVHKWDINNFKSSITGIKQGMSYTVSKAFPMLLMNTGINAQNKALQEIWKRRGVRYYMGFRNSDYYCPLCDELCSVPHPIADMVFPAHPRCVCGIYYIDFEV